MHLMAFCCFKFVNRNRQIIYKSNKWSLFLGSGYPRSYLTAKASFFFLKTTRKLYSRLAFLYTELKSLLIFLTVVKVDKQVSCHSLLGQHLFHVNSFWKTEVRRNLVAHILKQFGMLRWISKLLFLFLHIPTTDWRSLPFALLRD